MRGDSDPRLQKALSVNILEAARKAGATLKRAGAAEWIGPCLACGGTDRFSINTKEGVFNCRGGDNHPGGNVVMMARHCLGLDFGGALEWLTGEKRAGAPARRALRRDDAERDESPPYANGHDREGAQEHRQSTSEAPPAEPEPLSDKDREAMLEKAALRGPWAACYDYRDEMGVLISQKIRWEWKGLDGGKRKTFRQRRPARPNDDPAKIRDGFVWTRSGFDRVPYRLPELLEALAGGETAYLVEGEKKADLLWDWGLAATCTDQGAGRWAPELNQYFRGADLVILPDNDPQQIDKHGKPRIHKDGRPVIPGKDHAQAVGRALRPYASACAYWKCRSSRPRAISSIGRRWGATPSASSIGSPLRPRPGPQSGPARVMARCCGANSTSLGRRSNG
jgi:hypothetical protein